MKRPWIVFTGICSLVMGIVLFCVIFGGYSSLLRSQNRISTVTQMLTEQCTNQVEFSRRLAALADAEAFQDTRTNMEQAARHLKSLLIKMTAANAPLGQDLIRQFETAQAKLTRQTGAIITSLKKESTLPDLASMAKEQTELNTAVIVMVKQYNKEAAYFNTRSRQFPGIIIARIFSLDHLRFPKITPPLFIEEKTTSAT